MRQEVIGLKSLFNWYEKSENIGEAQFSAQVFTTDNHHATRLAGWWIGGGGGGGGDCLFSTLL